MTESALNLVSSSKSYNGHVNKYSHFSQELQCNMNFNVFLPKESTSQKVPAIYCLAGLTSTEDNFIQKSGAIRSASKHGIALICPDTSPRGANIEGEDDREDFGTGAGFYLDATEPKWAKNYRMYSYVVKELPDLVNRNLPIDGSKISIMGHSMGGHGALTIYLKNHEEYKTATAFAPILNPTFSSSLAKDSFEGYLGSNSSDWTLYDSTHLIKRFKGPKLDILIDQGTNDRFQEKLLFTENFVKAAEEAGRNGEIKIRMQDGYDHGYFFISTFIDDHLEHHARWLKA